MLDVLKIRDDFPMLKKSMHGKPLIYLDNGATTLKPQCVIDSVCLEMHIVEIMTYHMK